MGVCAAYRSTADFVILDHLLANLNSFVKPKMTFNFVKFKSAILKSSKTGFNMCRSNRQQTFTNLDWRWNFYWNMGPMQ